MLTNKFRKQNVATDGIELINWNPTLKLKDTEGNPNKITLQFSLWDFSGISI